MIVLSHGCTLDCFDCCKFNVYVKNGEIIKIEGDKKHPFTNGIICKKGRAHLERLIHKDRIYNPLLKVNGQWSEISFEKALEIMAEKLIFYKKKYSHQSVIYYEQYGSGSVLKSIGEIFFNFYGGGSRQKGGPCWEAGIKAQQYDFGDVRSHSLEDMLNSKSIFIWGKNPAYTTIHTMQMIKKAKANGSKIIVIDPIHTTTAKIADKYISINPGSDGALAFAMAKIIIDENSCDKEFINNYVLGFDEYKKYIEKLDLKYLIEKCGVCESDIRELVELYTDKYSCILIGIGMQKYTNGGNTIRAINSLGAITGQIGFSGGGINYANMVYPKILNLDPYNSKKNSQSREFYVSKISEFINQKHDNKNDIPIKMAVIVKSNLLTQLPNLIELERSIDSVEFKVCFDMFMTDTAKACDLFIPCTNTLESEDIVYSSMTNPYIIYNEKIIEPRNEFMDEYYFFRELAKIMNMNEYPQVSKNKYLEEVIKPLEEFYEDINLEKIKNDFIAIHKDIAWEEKEFKTKSNKIELYSKEAKEDGLAPIAQYISTSSNENKFRLLTTHHRDSLFSQHFMDKKGNSIAYINKNMAMLTSIEDNEVVSLKSKYTKIDVEIKIDDSIKDYVVQMYAGWWKKHGNPNFLIEGGTSDMGGQVVYNETFVDIIKQK